MKLMLRLKRRLFKTKPFLFCFKRFRTENFHMRNEPIGQPATQVNNAELKDMVETYPNQTGQLVA